VGTVYNRGTKHKPKGWVGYKEHGDWTYEPSGQPTKEQAKRYVERIEANIAAGRIGVERVGTSQVCEGLFERVASPRGIGRGRRVLRSPVSGVSLVRSPINGSADHVGEHHLDLPDGRTIHKRSKLPTAQFRAAKERCDVRIGDNRFTGDLHAYSIQATIEDVRVDVTLTGSTARPAVDRCDASSGSAADASQACEGAASSFGTPHG
jgi:hypothetical protein